MINTSLNLLIDIRIMDSVAYRFFNILIFLSQIASLARSKSVMGSTLNIQTIFG